MLEFHLDGEIIYRILHYLNLGVLILKLKMRLMQSLLLIKKRRSEIKNEYCIQNFTEDLILPYLIKKPTCNKYFSSWLASGYKIEQDYIEQLKVKKVKYILYNSPSFMVIDNISTPDRLKYVNKFILENYAEVFNLDRYKLLKIKD